jgi:hypothetical protein
MKKMYLYGNDIKRDNGSGYVLSKAFPNRRFHDEVVYEILYNGIQLDNSTVVSIVRVNWRLKATKIPRSMPSRFPYPQEYE